MTVFISAEQLADEIRHGKKLTVLSTNWEAQEGLAWRRFQSEHVPTALFCDPSVSLAGMPGSKRGRNPMPPIARLQEAFQKWGMQHDRPVVVYDSRSGVFAARAWWILRWAGVEDVKILDGGLREWERKGLPVLGGPGNITVSSDVEVQPDSLPTATMDEVREFHGLLVDARNENRWAGRREVLDLKAGHIPGALNVPVDELFDENKMVGSVDLIRDRLAQVGVTQNTDPDSAIVYSGSGNHSALLLAAMAHAGLPIISHYVGGWSQWSANQENQVARAI
ncbi:rhodanese-like domain-containing protein [Corynebacterium breve]|uniref:Rhodanese-like domain-containing protein n=1 Tax=Corynebacterium breve TaxID=3049799 RepID=A0ABY8VE92_9CORY|nr:rhodanese-like domain-containing protein [Corynebacterium breve]WIM67427.1 rhodanese-like domain-containing protein [Corynebacterium breve]